MKFQISQNCPNTIIFQTLDSGDYDYSECGSLEAAWQAEQTESWVKDAVAEGRNLESVKAEFLETLTEATPEEALQAANDNYGWPINLGFVEEIEDVVRYTIGLMANHGSFNRAVMVKVFFDSRETDNGSVVLTVESARNMEHFKQFKPVVLTRKQYNELSDEAADSLSFARSAFALFGITVAE